METTTLSTSRQFAVPSASMGDGALVPTMPLSLVVRAIGDASALSFDTVRATLQTYRLALAATRDVTSAFVAGLRPAPAKAPVAERAMEIVVVSTSNPVGLAPIEGEFMAPNAIEALSATAPRSSRRKRR